MINMGFRSRENGVEIENTHMHTHTDHTLTPQMKKQRENNLCQKNPISKTVRISASLNYRTQ